MEGGKSGAYIRNGRVCNETQVKYIREEYDITDVGNLTGHGEQDKREIAKIKQTKQKTLIDNTGK